MEAYVAAKANILDHQTGADWIVYGGDDPICSRLAAKAPGQPVEFSMDHRVERGACLEGQRIMLRWDGDGQIICGVDEIRLLGRHNVANVLAACSVAAAMGLPAPAMRSAVTEFTGVAHRLELVGEIGGARYYDDSIATSPERAIAAMRSFDGRVILLTGGRDKHLPWDSWASEAQRSAKRILLFGECADLVEREARSAWACGQGSPPPMERFVTMEEAVRRAGDIAREQDIVLLSPGGTSFDAYRDYQERGDHFQALVSELSEQ
jgi:UDP-N-acetylmuramoylalanine--D-glutamate ligase